MLLSPPSTAESATSAGAVISNGTVTLGVNREGDLNYNCVGAGDEGCPPSSAGGENDPVVGLRYAPLNLDAISPGCDCEGWGVADFASGLTGFVNGSSGDGNVTPESFSASATRAVSTVSISDSAHPNHSMRVMQDYRPSPLTSNLFVDTVTVTNTGSSALDDLRFRRVMDWDVEPTAFDEWVTIAGTSPQLRFDSDDGFATSNPLAGPSYIQSELACGPDYTGPCGFIDLGTGGSYPAVTTPEDHGALFDFGFGELGVGESRSLNIYYGAADSEIAALSALSAGGAQVYSLGQSNCSGGTIATCSPGAPDAGTDAGPSQGQPATFIFGFVTTLADLGISMSDSPDPVQAGQDLTYSMNVTNGGPTGASAAQVSLPLPAGVSLVSATPSQGTCGGSGDVVCDLGAIPSGGDAQVTVVVRPSTAAVGSINSTATVSGSNPDDNSSNNTDSASTEVLPAPAAAQQPPPPASDQLPPPVLFETANAAFVSGTVLIRLPDGTFVPLEGEKQVPVGSVIDTTNGVVAITSAQNAAGDVQTANFFGGLFRLVQVKTSNGGVFTQLVLVDGPSSRTLARRGTRKLWGSGKGNYKTKGGYGSATVRGTKWLTKDTDAGTLIKVVRGIVSVRDFARKKTTKVSAGKKLLVTPPGRPPGKVR